MAPSYWLNVYVSQQMLTRQACRFGGNPSHHSGHDPAQRKTNAKICDKVCTVFIAGFHFLECKDGFYFPGLFVDASANGQVDARPDARGSKGCGARVRWMKPRSSTS